MRDGSPRKPCGMILPPPAPRNRGRGKRRASPPPAEPSPFGNPHPGTPLHHRNSQRGRALLAQNIYSALGGRMLRGADPPRALRVMALANLCPCFAPVCPQRGRPGSKYEDEERTLCGSVLHAFASLQRQALVLARSRSLHRDARLAPSHPPARRA